MDIHNIETEANRISGIIQPTELFDFYDALALLVDSGASDRLDEVDSEAGTLSRALLLNDAPYRVFLAVVTDDDDDEQRDDASAHRIRVSVQAPDEHPAPDADILQAAADWANRRFWMNIDMMAVKEAVAVDEFGEELVDLFFPRRSVNYASAWDAILISVTHAQIYPGLATKLDNRLAETYGMQATFDGETIYLTPRPFDLLKAFPDELRGMQFSRQKADYLTSIPQTIMDNPQKFDFVALRDTDGQEVIQTLKELRGVGDWTSQNVAMRGLPHQDIFIDEDNLRETLAPFYFRSVDAIDKRSFREVTERFAPYRTFACIYSYMKYFDIANGDDS